MGRLAAGTHSGALAYEEPPEECSMPDSGRPETHGTTRPPLFPSIADAARDGLRRAFGQAPDEFPVDFATGTDHGDLTINAFHLARAFRVPPPRIAEVVAGAVGTVPGVTSVEAVKGYVNVTLAPALLVGRAIDEVLGDPAAFGRGTSHAGRRIMVEFSSPNTNKPQHLGHLRNNFLGDAVSRLLANAGADVVRASLVNDRGIHICKSMLAYEVAGDGADPAALGRKGDHFVGDYYVLFQNPAFLPLTKDERASAMLRRWEEGDAAVTELWRKMNGWVLDGFRKTYDAFDIVFDCTYFESETWRLGKELVLEHLRRGTFSRRADGAVEVDLTSFGIGDRPKVLLRADGTSVYITQDIGTTVRKIEDTGVDSQIFVVADEQRQHFQTLFRILELMGYPWAGRLTHLAYGLVNLPEGRMKSREGTVVDADDLLAEVEGFAREEIVAHDTAVSGPELAARARAIALGAMKFLLLRVNPTTTLTFDPKGSVAFEGDTGPYVMYACARIRRMLDDGGPDAGAPGADASLLHHPAEKALARLILSFPRIVDRAARDCHPGLVAQHALTLAQAFATYYQAKDETPILRAPDPRIRAARLALAAAVAATLSRALGLLGIRTVDRM